MALLGLTSLYIFFNNEQDDLTTLNNSAVTNLEAQILNANETQKFSPLYGCHDIRTLTTISLPNMQKKCVNTSDWRQSGICFVGLFSSL